MPGQSLPIAIRPRRGDARRPAAGNRARLVRLRPRTGRAHIGDLPHPLASHEGGLRGYHVGHVGRQIHPDDFAFNDLIIAMDRDNASDLERLRGGEESRRGFYSSVEPVQIQLLRRWDPFAMPGDEDIADPWGRPPRAYADMFDVIERSIPPLVEHLEWLVSESE